MTWMLNLWRSAVGKKAVMATTGIMLFGFVLLHMLGNLKAYGGAEMFNHYAEGLREVGAPFFPHAGLLWILRVILLAAVALHLLAAYQLTVMSHAARPVAYEERQVLRAGYAARTMRWGGVLLGLFILYHLAHLTTGWVHPDFDPGDAYHNLVVGFRNPLVSLFYIVAQVALGLHIYHGVWSLFQSLGCNNPRFNNWRDGFAHTFAWVIAAGNISLPLAVLVGIIR